MTIDEFFESEGLTLWPTERYHTSTWEGWMTAYSKVNSMELLTFLANIEAWLSFNQEPTKVQLQELKADIGKLLEKHKFDYDSK